MRAAAIFLLTALWSGHAAAYADDGDVAKQAQDCWTLLPGEKAIIDFEVTFFGGGPTEFSVTNAQTSGAEDGVLVRAAELALRKCGPYDVVDGVHHVRMNTADHHERNPL